MNEPAAERVEAYIARMRGQVLLQLRVAHPCGEFVPLSGEDWVCPAIVAARGWLGFWLAGEYEQHHCLQVIGARDDDDDLVILGRSGPATKYEVTLSPIWMPEQRAAVAETEKYRPASWACQRLREAIDALADEAAKQPDTARPEPPLLPFRWSELREPGPNHVFHLVGVMAVSGARKEGVFVSVPGLDKAMEHWRNRISYCLGQGTDLDEFLDYLFERANGITTTWSRPESIEAPDLWTAVQEAFAIARKRDREMDAR